MDARLGSAVLEWKGFAWVTGLTGRNSIPEQQAAFVESRPKVTALRAARKVSFD
jgi:hypothetical protein